MNEFIDALPMIPEDDIGIEYARADPVTRKAVTALMEHEDVKWIIATINMKKLEEHKAGQAVDSFSVGLYKSEMEHLTPLMIQVLAVFNKDNPAAMDSVLTAVSYWIAKHGGELLLHAVNDRVKAMLHV